MMALLISWYCLLLDLLTKESAFYYIPFNLNWCHVAFVMEYVAGEHTKLQLGSTAILVFQYNNDH